MGAWPLSGGFFTEGVRSGTGTLALPSSGELMGSSSSEHGSISPDSDAQPDAFFEKVQVPKPQLSHLLRYYPCPVTPCGGPSSVAEHLLSHTKGFCRGAREPVSHFCPFSSLVVPVLPLSPPPSTLPLSCLLFPFPSLPPCPCSSLPLPFGPFMSFPSL